MKRCAWLAFAIVPLLALIGCGGEVECQQVGDELVCVDVAEQAATVDDVANHGGGCGGGGGGSSFWKARLGQIDDVLANKGEKGVTLEQPKCDLANPGLCPMNAGFTVTVPRVTGPTGDPNP